MAPAVRLSGSTWPDLAGDRRDVLVVPLGSCEQHGPHLPFDTDTRIAEHLSAALAERVDGLVVAPSIGIGASGEHESFPGTLSIGTVALEAVLVELVRSALPPPGSPRPRPFGGVVLVNGHGGNVEATGRAAALLSDEGRDVLVWHPRVPDGDSHAGRTETSLLLHLDPAAVRIDRAQPGSTARWREIGDVVVAQGLAAVTANGVLGDPTTATAAEGEAVFVALVDALCASVEAWRDTLGR
ncbi:mycofactocin biosynthesis peptidyl-dipeptidase MftE [Dermatobacter hominis]|uniref:mycofactocin biosynthesis peptidyl-dipeptidase MftE n=1 Tax=Dermatobacter hominis TaxID=2884263 RepID=UPI001D12D90A|nr:mycofactocin biosynthesis peptidyl-dipeptidase MftE [Dermatobacter hominis]UDY37760.1 mycofactocin biosynthesis peptidyl-dipeptidase MftE [Dermatobacter hominis]